MDIVYQRRHLLGILLLLLSLLPFTIPESWKNGITLTLFFAFYCIGVFFVSDYVAEKFGGRSLFKMIFRSKKKTLIYFGVCLIGGLLLEIYVTYLGGFWWFPFYSTGTYLAVAVVCGGFGVYALSIISSYYAAKIILDKLGKGEKFVTKPYKFERFIYPSLFIAGLIGAGITIYEILKGTNLFRDFVFNISAPKEPYISFNVIILAFFSYWFIFEYIEHRRKRTSLIKDTLHGYLNPLAAIYIASISLLLYMELQNLPIKLWIYSYEPLGGMKILGLPFWIYVGWPLHYIAFISLYRALGYEPSEELLAGDKID